MDHHGDNTHCTTPAYTVPHLLVGLCVTRSRNGLPATRLRVDQQSVRFTNAYMHGLAHALRSEVLFGYIGCAARCQVIKDVP